MGSDLAATPVAAGHRCGCRRVLVSLDDGRHFLGETVCGHAAPSFLASLWRSAIAAVPAAAIWEPGTGLTGDGYGAGRDAGSAHQRPSQR